MGVIRPEMISREITRKDLLPLSFLKKSVYTGSKRSFNYRLAKAEQEIPQPEGTPQEGAAGDTAAAPEKRTVLRVWYWFGPFSYEVTDPAQIGSADMEFSDAGIGEAISFLNDRLREGEEKQQEGAPAAVKEEQ